jgi:hypothetical protein
MEHVVEALKLRTSHGRTGSARSLAPCSADRGPESE